MYLSRTEVLETIRRIESDYPIPGRPGACLRIRELLYEDARAARDAGEPDAETFRYRNEAMFYAVIVQRGVLDGPGGALLFSPDDLPALALGRTGIHGLNMRALGDAIYALSEADPDSFRGLDTPADETGNADAGGGAPDGGGNDPADGPGGGADDLGADGGDGAGRPVAYAG